MNEYYEKNELPHETTFGLSMKEGFLTGRKVFETDSSDYQRGMELYKENTQDNRQSNQSL